MALLDWSQCPAVESIPGKVSGAWVFHTFLTTDRNLRYQQKGYIDHFGFTIENWNTRKVAAELKRKGLDPSAKHPIYKTAL